MDAVWAAVIPVCVSILGGGLAMAWRLGSLSNSVKELNDQVDRLEARFNQLSRGGRRWTDSQ